MTSQYEVKVNCVRVEKKEKKVKEKRGQSVMTDGGCNNLKDGRVNYE